jgi:hypothetical protein
VILHLLPVLPGGKSALPAAAHSAAGVTAALPSGGEPDADGQAKTKGVSAFVALLQSALSAATSTPASVVVPTVSGTPGKSAASNGSKSASGVTPAVTTDAPALNTVTPPIVTTSLRIPLPSPFEAPSSSKPSNFAPADPGAPVQSTTPNVASQIPDDAPGLAPIAEWLKPAAAKSVVTEATTVARVANTASSTPAVAPTATSYAARSAVPAIQTALYAKQSDASVTGTPPPQPEPKVAAAAAAVPVRPPDATVVPATLPTTSKESAPSARNFSFPAGFVADLSVEKTTPAATEPTPAANDATAAPPVPTADAAVHAAAVHARAPQALPDLPAGNLPAVVPAVTSDATPSGTEKAAGVSRASHGLTAVAPAVPRTASIGAKGNAGAGFGRTEQQTAGFGSTVTPASTPPPPTGRPSTVVPSTNLAANAAVAPATPSAASAAAPSRTTATLSEQVATATATRAQLVSAGGSTKFYLRLEPPQLGTVHVHLQASDGAVNARLVVSSDAAKAALESQLPDLRARLGSAGVSVSNLDVSSGQAGTGRPDAGQADPSAAESAAGTAPARQSARAITAISAAEPGRVDVIA